MESGFSSLTQVAATLFGLVLYRFFFAASISSLILKWDELVDDFIQTLKRR